MEKVFGFLLLVIFIIAVGTFTFVYCVSINGNINKMLKRKGYSGYKEYCKMMTAKISRRKRNQIRQLEQPVSLPKKTNYTRKMAKRQQKKQVDAFYQHNVDQSKR